ncbi:MAG: helix-hairpin-helix domain-containing protein [Kangiella sp.]|nr:helix-hairpin-helix domain-containing protein [Kangiella sp.]
MPSVDLEDMVHMVHGELTSALASTSTFYDAPMVEISSIKVRMGQHPDSTNVQNLNLDTKRYPLAKDGWQLEVIYDAKSDKSRKSLEQFKQTGIPSINAYNYLSKLPVRYLKLANNKVQQALTRSGLKTLAELAEANPKQLSQVTGVPITSLRNLQASARLSLSDPNVFVPEEMLSQTLSQFLDNFPTLNDADYDYYSWNNLEVIFEWVQQLEFCLAPSLIKVTTFKKLLEQ